jgi:hypothetical protein
LPAKEHRAEDGLRYRFPQRVTGLLRIPLVANMFIGRDLDVAQSTKEKLGDQALNANVDWCVISAVTTRVS